MKADNEKGGAVQSLGRPTLSVFGRRGGLGLGILILLASLVAAGWLHARWQERAVHDPAIPEGTRLLLEEARRSPAPGYAQTELSLAEEEYRNGTTEIRREELRFFLWRDYRPALATLRRSESWSAAAIRMGTELESNRRASAAAVLAELGETLEILDELDARATLPREDRVGLSTTRMGFVEASILWEAGAFGEAEEKAMRTLRRAQAVVGRVGGAILRFADEERVESWRRWIHETVAWSREHNAVALVVIKERNLLKVYRNGQELHSYPADMGLNNLAQKYRVGDRATPEGKYKVKQVKERGQTLYYRALLLDYPTAEDLRRIAEAKRRGIVPSSAGPGALIEIHGAGGRGTDWTNGCVAVANPDMDALMGLVKVGTPVTIVGGDGSNGSFSSLAERLNRGR